MSQFRSPRTYGLLRKTLESNQIPEGTSRLAGGPYRHQGLSSVVLIIGLEPITSDVSGRRSHHWAIWAVADREGLEPSTTRLTVEGSTIELPVQITWMCCLITLRRDSNPHHPAGLFYRLNYWRTRTDIFHSWEQMESNHQADVLQTRAGPCRYSLFVHPTGFEPVTCCM